MNNVFVIVAKLYLFTDVPSPFDASLILWLSSYTTSLPFSIGIPLLREADLIKDLLNIDLTLSFFSSFSSDLSSLTSVLLSFLSSCSLEFIFSSVFLSFFLKSVIVSLFNFPSAKTTVFGTIIPNSIIKTKKKAVNFCNVVLLFI